MISSRVAPTRVGLVGCGVIAFWAHLRILPRLRGATFVAAADPDRAARERAMRLVQVPIYERSEDVFGRSDIDAVVISAPTHLHAVLAIAAATAGKHFYLEKPLATSVVDAHRVLDAASQAQVVGAIGFNRRFHPLYEQARRLLQGGAIGRVRAVQSAFCEPVPLEMMPEWKRKRATGGGVLLDLASHHIDLLRWFLKDEVAEVSAAIDSEASEQDSAELNVGMRSGVQVQGFFSFRAGLADYLEFIGERGTLRVDRHSPTLALKVSRRFGYGVRRPWVRPNGAVAAWRLQRLFSPSADPSYRRSLEAFVAVSQGDSRPSATLQDGMRSLQVLFGAEESDASGSSVPIPDTPGRAPCESC